MLGCDVFIFAISKDTSGEKHPTKTFFTTPPSKVQENMLAYMLFFVLLMCFNICWYSQTVPCSFFFFNAAWADLLTVNFRQSALVCRVNHYITYLRKFLKKQQKYCQAKPNKWTLSQSKEKNVEIGGTIRSKDEKGTKEGGRKWKNGKKLWYSFTSKKQNKRVCSTKASYGRRMMRSKSVLYETALSSVYWWTEIKGLSAGLKTLKSQKQKKKKRQRQKRANCNGSHFDCHNDTKRCEFDNYVYYFLKQ